LIKILSVAIDVRTRWNSSLHMLIRALKLRIVLDQFLQYYTSAVGRKDFAGSKTKLEKIEDSEWAFATGIIHLLRSFNDATRVYSTFVSVPPFLCMILSIMGKKLCLCLKMGTVSLQERPVCERRLKRSLNFRLHFTVS